MKRFFSIMISLIMVMAMAVNVTAMENYDSTIGYLTKNVTSPTISSIGGEWTVIGVARSGKLENSDYLDRYYSNAENLIKSKNGVLSTSKYTEYSRAVLALTSIGKDPTNVAGYNLVEPVMAYDKVIRQGLNGPVWALIALDCGNYGDSEIRDKYLSYILERELKAGGWSLSGGDSKADADVTAMVLTALAPYAERVDVGKAVNRGIKQLSEMQDNKGGYSTDGTVNSESSAQVLTAISSLGISYKDKRFVKNGNTIVDNLISYRNKDGSFSHTDKSNLMATEQCLYALIAADRLEKGMKSLFDMSDISRKSNDVSVPEVTRKGITFADIQNHSCRNSVERLAERGIINGMSENCFAPDNTMTRAEFTAITVRALGLPVKSGKGFTDVKSGDWFKDYVNTACSYGIVKGVSETRFDPQGKITREQAAVMMIRAAKLCGMEDDIDGSDVDSILNEYLDGAKTSSWAKDEMATCLSKGILVRNSGNLIPGENVKRYEIADMIYNMLKEVELI